MSFARLRAAEWVVLVAALALLLSTAVDWYSTAGGEAAREVQQNARPDEGASTGPSQTEVEEAARLLAEGAERNAWQEDGALDRIILLCLLATSALGVVAAFRRAGGHGGAAFGAAGAAACVTALLVLYRILQEPGFDEVTVVKAGAPLALGLLGVMAFACATALREPAAAG